MTAKEYGQKFSRRFHIAESERKPRLSVCEVLQLLQVSVFRLSGEISTENQFALPNPASESPHTNTPIVPPRWYFGHGIYGNSIEAHRF
jgi:hypothetical protein